MPMTWTEGSKRTALEWLRLGRYGASSVVGRRMLRGGPLLEDQEKNEDEEDEEDEEDVSVSSESEEEDVGVDGSLNA